MTGRILDQWEFTVGVAINAQLTDKTLFSWEKNSLKTDTVSANQVSFSLAKIRQIILDLYYEISSCAGLRSVRTWCYRNTLDFSFSVWHEMVSACKVSYRVKYAQECVLKPLPYPHSVSKGEASVMAQLHDWGMMRYPKIEREQGRKDRLRKRWI